MALRTVLTEENPALRKVCRPYTAFNDRLHQLLDDMRETLKEANGVGLAAPQVTYVMQELKAAGFPVNTDATTIEEAADEIMRVFHK